MFSVLSPFLSLSLPLIPQLERTLESVTTANPEVLQRQIYDLKIALSTAERSMQSYQQRAEAAITQVAEQDAELGMLRMRCACCD